MVATLLVIGSDALAIPAFARKYQTSCGTCHEAYPRLNAIGESYRLNGFKFADDDLYIKEDPVELGDEAYKKLWPKAIWPGTIPGLPPIAIVLRSTYQIDIGGTNDARSEFIFPETAKILAAGAFGEHISFFFELGLDRSGGTAGHGGDHGTASSGTVTDIQGWVMFEDLLGPDNLLNVRIGTVGMQEMGLFMARDHNRLSVNPYLYSSWAMPAPTHHFAEALGLAEDGAEFTGNPFMLHAQPGVEINGFGRRWRYAVGTVNGNGDEIRDNNSEKDIYWQLAYKIGGLGFDGSGGSDSGQLADSESWRDNSIILSTFGYWGTAGVSISGTTEDEHDEGHSEAVTFDSSDQFWRIGFGAQGKYDDLTVRGGVVFGHNENPYGHLSGNAVESCSWFAEAEYVVLPWLIPYARFEGVRLDLPQGVEGITAKQDRRRVIVGAKAQIRSNVTFTAEGRFYMDDERNVEQGDDDQIVFALEAAF